MAPATTKAVLHLTRQVDEADKLKRLALLFDEVHYVLPIGAGISREALADPTRYTVTNGRLLVHDFQYFRDIERGWHLAPESLPSVVRDTLAALTDAGIAVDSTPDMRSTQRDAAYGRLRGHLLSRDMDDPKWNRMTGTKPVDYRLSGRIKRVRLKRVGGEEEEVWWHLEEPTAISAADLIASVSYLAYKNRRRTSLRRKVRRPIGV